MAAKKKAKAGKKGKAKAKARGEKGKQMPDPANKKGHPSMDQKKKAVARKEEEFRAEWQSPLKWLEAQPRTRHQDRIGRSNWKGSIAEYRKRLDQQLKRIGWKKLPS